MAKFRPATQSIKILLALGVCQTALAMPAFAQDAQGEEAKEIIVTGSRIPTVADEGPSAVTVVDSEAIRANGYTNVPELLASLTQ